MMYDLIKIKVDRKCIFLSVRVYSKSNLITKHLNLRVLLVKQPDISEPTFLTQYQIIYNMKSTYRINVPGTKI